MMSISILRKSLLSNNSVIISSRQIPYLRTFATGPSSPASNEKPSEKGSTENNKSKFKIDRSHILPAILSLWTVLTIDNYFELGFFFKPRNQYFDALPSEDTLIMDENVRRGRLPLEKRQKSTEEK